MGTLRIDGDADPGSFDRIERPTIDKARLDLCSAHPSRTPVARLAVTEAQHEIAAAGNENCVKVPNQTRPIPVIEDVEQTTVQDGVVTRLGGVHLQRILHEESGVEVPLTGLQLGESNSPGRQIDTGCFEAETGGQEGVLTGTASNVEGPAGHSAGTRQLREGRLWMTDVPGRCALVGGVELDGSVRANRDGLTASMRIVCHPATLLQMGAGSLQSGGFLEAPPVTAPGWVRSPGTRNRRHKRTFGPDRSHT